MTILDPIAIFNLLLLPAFLDAATCVDIAGEMRAAEGDQATIYGVGSAATIDERVRKVMRQTPSPKTVEYINKRLWGCKSVVEDHFKIKLTECDPPQFLRYRIGDFFVAHQDGNTGLIRSDTEARRISVVIPLTQQSDQPGGETYGGGSLVFHDWRHGRGSGELPPHKPGTFVAFPAETTHEVTPVTHGERFSIACWYR